MTVLDKIESPADLRSLDSALLPGLCREIRDYMVDCCSTNPGHLGASLGTIELTVALHRVFDTPYDEIVWDVGHQAYAHKILTGRREAFRKNRKWDGISGFPKRSESPYDAFGTGHSSTSIAAALGLAVAAGRKGEKRHLIAVIGDGAMTGGLAYEGLNYAGSLNDDILIILNDNHISIDDNTGALHNYLMRLTTSSRYNAAKERIWDRLQGTRIQGCIQKIVKNAKRSFMKGDASGSLFDSLGCRYFGPVDGHDLDQLIFTLNRLKGIKGPKLLHVVTVKGKGYKPAEENQTLWHAPGRFDPGTGMRIPRQDSRSRYQDVFGQTLSDLMDLDDRIVGVTPAMATGCGMNIAQKTHPERVYDVGIAEQCAVTFASGLAAGGLVPFCNIYSSFMQRSYDNVIHDAALQGLKVIFCLDRAGLVGEDGATHTGAFDMAFFRPIPGLTIASPMNERELRDMMYSATDGQWKTPVIRYPRGCGQGVEWKETPFRYIGPGSARKLSEGRDVALLSIGPVGNKAAEAAARAAEAGIGVLHYDMRFLKPLDIAALEEACALPYVITVEDGSISGGLASAVAEHIAESSSNCRLIPLGIPDRFIKQGTPEEQYSDCGFNVDDIFEALAACGKKK